MDWKHAVITSLQFAGDKPICPVNRRRRVFLRPDGMVVVEGELGV